MTTEMGWGSDAIAQLLREMGFEYAALVPGSSFRGLHDSLVNYLGDEKPKMLVCLHEEHAVALAHGYAKVAEKPLLAIVHANVGLMHAAMAFYDAWGDRAPVVVLGANGPHDAMERRPWIDWLHTMRDQAAIVRHYTKWDAEPGSIPEMLESIVRAYQIASTPPHGPTYVVMDVALQEQKLAAPLPMPQLARYAPPQPAAPDPADVDRAIALLRAAKAPVIVVGRSTRSVDAWNDRVALAEALNAKVVTDIKNGATFPTDHPLHMGPPAGRLTKPALEALRGADVILSLEAIDLAGTLKQAFGDQPPAATIIASSIDRYIHNGFTYDHQALPPVDLSFAVPSDKLVEALVAKLGRPTPKAHANGSRPAPSTNGAAATGEMGMESFSAGLNEAFAGREVCFIRLPLGANSGAGFHFHHPLDFLGGDGGGGVGAGPGMAVGGALALRGTKRLPVAVLGDGDYLMGLTALWTAVANDIPLLVIVANNHCYNNDVVHQDRMAVVRHRPVERKWIGQTIKDPTPDLAMLARGQGAIGIGRVERREDLAAAVAEGIKHVEAGKVCVVDVYVSPDLDERNKAATSGYAGSQR